MRVGLDTTLVQRPRRNSLGSSAFKASARVSPLSLDAVVAAFDGSLREVMEKVVAWTLRTGAAASS